RCPKLRVTVAGSLSVNVNTPLLCFACEICGAGVLPPEGFAATVTDTVAGADVPSRDVPVYVKLSLPLYPAFGVYVTEPPLIADSFPWAGPDLTASVTGSVS